VCGSNNNFPFLELLLLQETMDKYHLNKPSTWTTITGLVVESSSGLCLGSRTPMDNSGIDFAIGSQIQLKPCNAAGEIQWLYGSDLKLYTYEKQLKMNPINRYASVDNFEGTPSPSPAPTALIPWRNDLKCGPNFAGRMENGDPWECNPNSPIAFCCNPLIQSCGKGSQFCDCEGCIDYSDRRLVGMEDSIYDEFFGDMEGSHDEAPRTYTEQLVTGTHSPTMSRNGNRKLGRRLGSSKEPGFSLQTSSSPVGVCLNAFVDTKAGRQYKALNTDLCTSNQMQGWELTDEGWLRNMQWPDYCVSVKKTDLVQASMVGTELHLESCKSSQYQPMIWTLPNYDKKLLNTLTHHSSTNVNVVTHDPCYFLSNPKSDAWWPTDSNRDNHKTCLNFFNENNDDASTIKYKVPKGYNRFQTHVGVSGAGENPVGKIEYQVFIDGQFATQVDCQAEELKYGEVRQNNETIYPYLNRTGGPSNPNYNNRSHAYIKTTVNDAFMTVKVRNMCSFKDCTYTTIDQLFGADEENNPCLKSSQAIDVVVADASVIELKIRQSGCTTTTAPDGTVIKTGCGSRPFAAFGTPTFTNAVREGEESQKEYTDRMLWGMHATIFEPVWVIYIGMEIFILFIDCIAIVIIFYALWYWLAYKRSRKYLSIAWAITFVGPLAVSCIPVRMFIPWDRANGHIENYLLDFERRYNLQRYEDMVLETCRTFTEGYGDTAIEGLIGTVTSLCAKKLNVPATCPTEGPEILDKDDPCFHFQSPRGGALEWADEVNPPMVNELVYSDLLYTSPSNQRVAGFPGTCYDIFGDTKLNEVCDDGFVYPQLDGEAAGQMPCECTTTGCALTGMCRLSSSTEIECASLYQYMNCSLVNKYYKDICDCTCSVDLENPPPTPEIGINNVTVDAPDWYYDDVLNLEFCVDGMIETMVPKVNAGTVWVPFKGNVDMNSYPMHVDCGKARGLLFEGKFDAAIAQVRETCGEIIDMYESNGLSAMAQVLNGLRELLTYATQLAGLSASVYNAITMFQIALPVALCIGPALLRGALRTKLLVPQSATPGLFIQLLPWLYCPIVWCLFNFLFQILGNIYLLPGLLLLAYTPMTYFVVGVKQELSKPMTKDAINRVIYWLDVFCGISNAIAYTLLLYGLYYTFFEDPNSKFLADNIMMKLGGSQKRRIAIIVLCVFMVVKVIFKYVCTTCTGVDFMMYELIQQRFYEMFLERGDDTAIVLQEARANRLDAFCMIVKDEKRSRKKKGKHPPKKKKKGKKKKRKHKHEKLGDNSSSGGSFPGASNGYSSGENSGPESLSGLSTDDLSDMDLSDVDSRESSFASSRQSRSSGSSNSHRLAGSASISQVLKKQASVWDMINNGQPRPSRAIPNYFNAIFTTFQHLKRSRSKLEIHKKMASRAEVAYLSKKFGLTHTPDSAIVYELLVWRRSSLWVLMIFGTISTLFALAAINKGYQNSAAYFDLAHPDYSLHRFPKPGELDQYTLDHFRILDPSNWTRFSGPISTNVTDPSTGRTEKRYLSLVGTSAKSVTAPAGLFSEYQYNKPYMQWGLNEVNGTLRNEGSLCLQSSSKGTFGWGEQVFGFSCINDFLYDKVALNKNQIWGYNPSTKQISSFDGLFCLAYDKTVYKRWHDPDDTGRQRCGTLYPLTTMDPGQCDPASPDKYCCNNEYYGWTNKWSIDTFIGGTCGSSEDHCTCDDCIDYRDEKYQKPLSNVPVVVAKCDDPNDANGGPLQFDMPDEKNVIERLHSYCNDVNNCLWANQTTMYAMYDYGSTYFFGDDDKRWRCYSKNVVIEKQYSIGGQIVERREYDKVGNKYCDLHMQIVDLLERSQGREDFKVYQKRMSKVAYARMMVDAEAATVSINIILILLAWAALILASLSFHLYSKYKLSRSLVMLGWLCTFLAPFLLSIIPLRLFIKWDDAQEVQDAMMMELRDEYGLDSKESALIETCAKLEEDETVDSMIDLVLAMCAYTKEVTADHAYNVWGDSFFATDRQIPMGAYHCQKDAYNSPPQWDYTHLMDKPYNQTNTLTGYPPVGKDPCKGIDGLDGQAWIDKGDYICNNGADCNCPEGEAENCDAAQSSSTAPDLEEWKEMCENMPSDQIQDLYPLYYDGYVSLLLMTSSTEDTGVNQELSWPFSIFVSDVSFDLNEVHTECGQARRHICQGEFKEAEARAKAACAEIRAFLDDDQGTDAQSIEETISLLMGSMKELTEISISLIHSLKSFKMMSSATFALAPALIRSAIRVKTAVPQNSISGMFVIVLPWLYSPLVWCVYNLVFQVIGNWPLLFGLIIMAYGPVAFFIVGVWKDITRPMPDKEIHVIRVMCTVLNRLKLLLSAILIGWGLWKYTFEEQEEYTNEYKETLMDDFSTISMLELCSNIMMKYYYTTLVGVDYMLAQILSARKYEVYMEMASKSEKWKNSRPAKRAAELKEHYVHLMNNFCHMAGLSTADLPAFANYRLHKLNKKRREEKKQKEEQQKAANKTKTKRQKRAEKKTFLQQVFSRPPDRSVGVPDVEQELIDVGFTGDVTRDNRGLSIMEMSENPLADKRRKKRKSKKNDEESGGVEMKDYRKQANEEDEDDSEDERDTPQGSWVICTDPQSGKKYRYNGTTGITEWLEDITYGRACAMEDDELTAMLAKPPKEVPEMHSREAFKKFFRGIAKKRMQSLLEKCYEGKDRVEDRIKKRMKLLEGEFYGDKDFQMAE